MVDPLHSNAESRRILDPGDLLQYLWLADLAENERPIDHKQYINERILFRVQTGRNLESRHPLLPLILSRFPLDMLDRDITHLQHHIVTVVDQGIGVLDTDLDIAHVLDIQHVGLRDVFDVE